MTWLVSSVVVAHARLSRTKSPMAQSYDHLEPPPLATETNVEIVQPRRTIRAKRASHFRDYLQLQNQKRELRAFTLPNPTQRTPGLGTAAPSSSLRPPAPFQREATTRQLARFHPHDTGVRPCGASPGTAQRACGAARASGGRGRDART